MVMPLMPDWVKLLARPKSVSFALKLAHAALSKQSDHFIAGHGLRLAAQLFAAFFAKKAQPFIGGGCLSAFAAAAVQALDGYNRGQRRRHKISRRFLLHTYFHGKHSLAALDPIATAKKCLGDFLAIHERSIGRSQIAQKATRRRNLEQAVMPGKELVFGKIEMRSITTSDQQRIFLVERE